MLALLAFACIPFQVYTLLNPLSANLLRPYVWERVPYIKGPLYQVLWHLPPQARGWIPLLPTHHTPSSLFTRAWKVHDLTTTWLPHRVTVLSLLLMSGSSPGIHNSHFLASLLKTSCYSMWNNISFANICEALVDGLPVKHHGTSHRNQGYLFLWPW